MDTKRYHAAFCALVLLLPLAYLSILNTHQHLGQKFVDIAGDEVDLIVLVARFMSAA